MNQHFEKDRMRWAMKEDDCAAHIEDDAKRLTEIRDRNEDDLMEFKPELFDDLTDCIFKMGLLAERMRQ